MEDTNVSQSVPEYPHTDDLGFTWVSSTTFLADKEGPCFMCKTLTKRLDVCFEGYYCGSDECDAAIDAELRRLA